MVWSILSSEVSENPLFGAKIDNSVVSDGSLMPDTWPSSQFSTFFLAGCVGDVFSELNLTKKKEKNLNLS